MTGVSTECSPFDVTETVGHAWNLICCGHNKFWSFMRIINWWSQLKECYTAVGDVQISNQVKDFRHNFALKYSKYTAANQIWYVQVWNKPFDLTISSLWLHTGPFWKLHFTEML